MENSTMSEEELLKVQEEALAELENIISSCNNIDALIQEVSAWQDKYNIIDIGDFFTDESLLTKARNLLNSKLQELKKEKENATQTLNMIAQRRTFLRLYTICSDAKNYKDFETAQMKLNNWLKDHPEDTWQQFDDVYQNYFKKFANEKYLSFVTGRAEQEKVISTLEEIVDYSISYSNFAFFQENLQRWESDYANRDNYLNSKNRQKIDDLLDECYKKLTPPDVDKSSLEEFDTLVGAIACQSLLITIYASANKPYDTIDWISKNMSVLTTLAQKDSNKISDIIMEQFKINNIPKKFSLTIEDVEHSSANEDINSTAINYFLYKINSSSGLVADDKEIFEAVYIKSSIQRIKECPENKIDNEEKVVNTQEAVLPSENEIVIQEKVVEIVDTQEAETPSQDELVIEKPVAEVVDTKEAETLSTDVVDTKTQNPFSRIVVFFQKRLDPGDTVSINTGHHQTQSQGRKKHIPGNHEQKERGKTIEGS